MPDTLVMLRVEHRNFLRVLDVLDGLTVTLKRTGAADITLMRQVMAYFQGYPECCHHPKEDLVFRRLQELAPEDAARIRNLVEDHEEIAARVTATLDRIEAHTKGPDPELVEALEDFVATYRDHLWEEEREFFPIIETVLDPDDWAAIDFTMFDRDDPVFDASAEAYYRELRHAILQQDPPASQSAEA